MGSVQEVTAAIQHKIVDAELTQVNEINAVWKDSASVAVMQVYAKSDSEVNAPA